jgi:hypothetical protein
VLKAYYVVDHMKWCSIDDVNGTHCESHQLDYTSNFIHSCEVDGVRAGFCQLCSDNQSVGYDLSGGVGCNESYTGSLFLPLRSTVLAAEKCAGAPTVAPGAPTSGAPTLTAPTSGVVVPCRVLYIIGASIAAAASMIGFVVV